MEKIAKLISMTGFNDFVHTYYLNILNENSLLIDNGEGSTTYFTLQTSEDNNKLSLNTINFTINSYVKSTNSKNFEFHIVFLGNKTIAKYLEQILFFDIKEIFFSILKRGKIIVNIDCSFNYNNIEASFFSKLNSNHNILDQQLEQRMDFLVKMKKKMGLTEKIDKRDLPLIFSLDQYFDDYRQNIIFDDKVIEELKKYFVILANKLNETRQVEGRKIAEQFLFILNHFYSLLTEIKNIYNQDYENKIINFKERFGDLIIESLNKDIDNNTFLEKKIIKEDFINFLTESCLWEDIINIIEKGNIQEEITRLQSHLELADAVIYEKELLLKGKKLDFIAQEINREINTIASKVGNAKIRHLIIDFKSYLEQWREQSANIQ